MTRAEVVRYLTEMRNKRRADEVHAHRKSSPSVCMTATLELIEEVARLDVEVLTEAIGMLS